MALRTFKISSLLLRGLVSASLQPHSLLSCETLLLEESVPLFSFNEVSQDRPDYLFTTEPRSAQRLHGELLSLLCETLCSL